MCPDTSTRRTSSHHTHRSCPRIQGTCRRSTPAQTKDRHRDRQAKNRNNNPVADRAVQELESELLQHDPLGGPVTQMTHAVATSTLNARIGSRGLSAREMGLQRDQIPLQDRDIILRQNEQRIANHPHSM